MRGSRKASKFVCLVATLAVGWLGATSTSAEEGLFWKASAPGRPTLLLMPTLHILPDPGDDINTVLTQALIRVNSVVIESPALGMSQTEEEALKNKEIYPQSDSLENYVGVSKQDALHACAEKAHLPYDAFTRFKPWALTLLVMHRVKSPPAYEGFEARLSRGALAAHRNFATLVTTSENAGYLASVPQRLQVIELLEACKRFDRPLSGALVQDITRDWRAGDVKTFAVDIERPTEPGDVPELTQASDFMYARGTSLFWAALMSERIQSMKEPILVAVGAAHLIGASSMLPLLEEKGYQVQRVNLDKFPMIPIATRVAGSGSGN